MCPSVISFARDALRAHSSVEWEAALRLATVVPHEPAPRTVTFIVIATPSLAPV